MKDQPEGFEELSQVLKAACDLGQGLGTGTGFTIKQEIKDSERKDCHSILLKAQHAGQWEPAFFGRSTAPGH